MQIEIPKEIAYFYECTGKSQRLFYWIPKNELRRMIRENKAKESILTDYPNGVDIKVNKIIFNEFHQKYDMIFDINPEEVYNAFHSLWLKDKNSFREPGYLNKDKLEKLAKDINKDIKKKLQIPKISTKIPKSIYQRKKIITSQIKIRQKRNQFLENYRLPQRRRGPDIRQFKSDVEMTKGEENPYKVFNNLQRRKRG